MIENKVIRVDEEVWGKLKKIAEPFVDTPNSVLRRLLNLEGKKPRKADKRITYRRIERGEGKRRTDGLSVKDCYVPLLLTLVEHGGRLDTDKSCRIVKEVVKEKIAPSDYDLVGAAQVPKHRNKIQWARKHLVIDGLMKDDSAHGIWEISEEGRKFLQSRGLI